jgi:hypothetical protein
MTSIAELLGIDCSDILEADEDMPIEEFVRMTLEEIAKLPMCTD